MDSQTNNAAHQTSLTYLDSGTVPSHGTHSPQERREERPFHPSGYEDLLLEKEGLGLRRWLSGEQSGPDFEYQNPAKCAAQVPVIIV